MTFTTRKTVQSALPGFEDVKFTLNKMTEGRRIKLRLSLAPHTAKLRDLMGEANRMQETNDTDAAAELLEKVKVVVDDDITPAWVRWGLHKIHGLTVNVDDCATEPAVLVFTADQLIDIGPPALYAEIVTAIKAEAGITEQQQGESAPLTTSDAQVGGEKNITSAGTAENKVTT